MVRYPHTCTFYIPGQSSKDVNGDFSFDDSILITTSCRVEPEFQSLEISENGLTHKVKHKVYSEVIEANLNNAFIEYESVKYQIIRCWRYQTHLEIWI